MNNDIVHMFLYISIHLFSSIYHIVLVGRPPGPSPPPPRPPPSSRTPSRPSPASAWPSLLPPRTNQLLHLLLLLLLFCQLPWIKGLNAVVVLNVLCYHPFPYLLTLWLTDELTHSLTHWHAIFLTKWLTYSLTHWLTYSLSHALTDLHINE